MWTTDSAPDNYEQFSPNEPFNPSFFVLTWMSAYQSIGNNGSTALDSLSCRVAVSFDNQSFEISTGTPSTIREIQNAEGRTPGNCYATQWGSKIDVCGDAGDFNIHAIWHSPVDIPYGKLAASTGGCILVRPYVTNYAPGSPSGFPPTWFANIGSSTPVFNPLVAFTMGSTPSLSNIDYAPSITYGGIAENFDMGANAPTPIRTPGIYEALYAPASPPIVGDLGSSNQRRIVMEENTSYLTGYGGTGPGNLPYPNSIWLSQKQTLTPSLTTDWSPKFIVYNSNLSISTPSMGVYKRSKTSDQDAYAIAWIDYESPPATPPGVTEPCWVVNLVIKETDNNHRCCTCFGTVFQIPLVPTYIATPTISGQVASTTAGPVVTPLTALVSPGTSTDRYCLGWVVTFSGIDATYSVVILRGTTGTPEVSNDNWGSGIFYLANNGVNQLDIGDYLSPSTNLISATSNENNADDLAANPNGSTQELVLTNDGSLRSVGVWAQNVTYSTAGDLELPQSTPVPIAPPAPPNIYWWQAYYDRNPSVTITSAGQKIAAWEHLEGDDPVVQNNGKGAPYSSIRIAQSKQGGGWPTTPIADFISCSPSDLIWSLLNPSVTAFPKNSLDPYPSGFNPNLDPAAAELLYWYAWRGWMDPGPDELLEYQYYGKYGNIWSGGWHLPPNGWAPLSGNYVGANSQRSFGVYNTGPQFSSSDKKLYDDQAHTTPYVHGLSDGVGNDISIFMGFPEILKTVSPAVTADIGAFKELGTFDTALGVQLYRSESRVKDTSMVTFKWGKVYVEDTALGLPIREVMLHNGIPDSTGFASHDAMRDSIFATEWFNWPVSAEIDYGRLMLMPQVGTFDSVINSRVVAFTVVDSTIVDSVMTYDTSVDSTIFYDTVRSTFNPDSTRRTDMSFFAPGTQIRYTVQLVHQSGHIDTVEQAIYNPSIGKYITPLTVRIANAGYAADTVMLRVLGDFTNVSDADLLVNFARETMLDTYPSFGDTTIAIGTGGGVLPPPDTCFYTVGPYPNPSAMSGENVSVLVHLCIPGNIITAQVYNIIGGTVGSAVTYMSDGQVWDRLDIPAPSSAGTYYIHVTVLGYTGVLGYSVF